MFPLNLKVTYIYNQKQFSFNHSPSNPSQTSGPGQKEPSINVLFFSTEGPDTNSLWQLSIKDSKDNEAREIKKKEKKDAESNVAIELKRIATNEQKEGNFFLFQSIKFDYKKCVPLLCKSLKNFSEPSLKKSQLPNTSK